MKSKIISLLRSKDPENIKLGYQLAKNHYPKLAKFIFIIHFYSGSWVKGSYRSRMSRCRVWNKKFTSLTVEIFGSENYIPRMHRLRHILFGHTLPYHLRDIKIPPYQCL